MLRVNNLTFKRGERVLFEALSFVVHAGQRLAIAGRNGVGKSTLLELILGRLSADSGAIDMPPNWQLGYLEQQAQVSDRRALDYVMDGDRKLRELEDAIAACEDEHQLAELHMGYADAGGYDAEARAGEILSGLGFAPDAQQKSFRSFSGGWRVRLELAQTLMSPCDLLLLDEPTNHLDLEAIVWLERWIAHFPGTVILIAHDRAFLDNCVDHTLYLSAQRGQCYAGNYSACERARSEALNLARATSAKTSAKAAHMRQFVDRFRAKASKAKQVQSRLKALEKLQTQTHLGIESAYQVSFQDPEKASNPLLSCRDLKLGYDQQPVLGSISQSILPGARIGVLGANGAGKTTLLRALVGDLIPLDGELLRGQHCEVGYFAQHQLEELPAQTPVLSVALNRHPEWRAQEARDYLGGWGFDGDKVTRPIETLSGGEKSRLVLALIAATKPAMMILDEPTNHLDMDIREALTLALQSYSGAVVIVSHDRQLLASSVDDFWLVNEGGVSVFRGDIDDYLSRRMEVTQNTEKPDHDRRRARQERAQQREATKKLRDEVRRLEKQIDKDQTELQQLETRLADSDTYQSLPSEELDELLARSAKLRQRLEQLEESWLSAAQALEADQKDNDPD